MSPMSDDLSHHSTSAVKRSLGRSFGPVADAYDRTRPSYSADAAHWLTGQGRQVVELGAGTGQLTARLLELGHGLVATDPLLPLVRRLADRLDVPAVVASAEHIPVASRSVDVVVCAQSFHWFEHDDALPEIARILKPGGQLAVVWNLRDEGTPWVRKLNRIIGAQSSHDLVQPLMETPYFGFVDSAKFRFWQNHTAATLLDMMRTRSDVLAMTDRERDELLARVLELYDSYGRGYDGMQLPYITHCYRAVVRHQVEAPVPPPRRHGPSSSATEPGSAQEPPARPGPPEDPGTQLIDFR